MKKLEEHMVLNPELKKSFDDNVRKSKAKAKSNVRTFTVLAATLADQPINQKL